MSSQRYFRQLSGASHNDHVELTRLLNITTTYLFYDIRAATVFTGLAVIIIILCIIAFVLFFMCRQVPKNSFQNICMILKKIHIYTTQKGHLSLQNYKIQLPCRSSDVFKICGAMQLLSGLCLAIGKIKV